MAISDERKEFIEAYPESAARQVSFKKGDFIGQKYEVVDILGEGGCGTVYATQRVRTSIKPENSGRPEIELTC
jgi:hypothetical protein